MRMPVRLAVVMIVAVCFGVGVVMVVMIMIVTTAFVTLGVVVVIRLFVIVIVGRVVTTAVVAVSLATGVLDPDGGQIEDAKDHEANAGHEHHRAKDSIRGQVGIDSTGCVKVEHHSTPKEQEGNADEVNERTLNSHEGIRV
tara:strand:+ start:168 stop:590 length:423 start_codon:yes stop_codon:yes gene_type:complete